MSVLKSKRSVAASQFLENLKKLEQEVLTWCKSQGRKNNDYGLTDLFKSAEKAYVNAAFGNKVYLAREEDMKARKKYFDTAIHWLHTFNCELTALQVCFPISNTKMKRWMGYVYQAINQMEQIKKSDAARIRKQKSKR